MNFNWKEVLWWTWICLCVVAVVVCMVVLIAFIYTFVGPVWAIVVGVLTMSVGFGTLMGIANV